jgi:hypothetical protein
MTSPYLDRSLIRLAVALPRMLAKIETEIATAGPIERTLLPTSRVDARTAHADPNK